MTVTSEELSDFELFADLSRDELTLVAECGRREHRAVGDRLFTEGQPARGCWLIEQGRIALDFGVPGRGRVVIQTMSAGNVVGLSWMVPGEHWQFGAVVVEPTTAIRFDTDRLSTLAEADARFGHALSTALFGALLQRLHSTRARLLDLYRNPRE